MEQGETPEGNPEKRENATRGRSKKRALSKKGKSKKKREPFSRIASGILPSAAVASASPNVMKYVGKNRSPSPLARAVVFAGKIGHSIVAGPKLGRSLSVQELFFQSQSAGLAQSKNLSKSHPGPSRFPIDDEVDFAPGYESIKGVSSGIDSKDIVKSPVAGRPPMPLPDESDVKESAQIPDHIYSKVVKQGRIVEKLQKMGDQQDDSDDLTFVSEMEEDLVPGSFSKRAQGRQLVDAQNEDSSGPSDGEIIYRLPFDAITNEPVVGRQFETIEELEGENFKSRSGVVSPASARSKASSHDSTGGQERRQSRPQTPRDMGREAALKRLEELGFDAISKEFGMSLNSSYNSGAECETVEGPLFIDVVQSAPSHVQADIESPATDQSRVMKYPEASGSVAAMAKMFDSHQRMERAAKNDSVVEEPHVGFSQALYEMSSHEMRLDDLMDERQSAAPLPEDREKPATVPSSPGTNLKVIMSSRSGDALSSGSGDVMSYRSGDVMSSRSGDVMSSKSGDVMSSKSGVIRSSKSGDVMSSKSGDVIKRSKDDVSCEKSVDAERILALTEQGALDPEIERQKELLQAVLQNQEALSKRVDDMCVHPERRQSPQGGSSHVRPVDQVPSKPKVVDSVAGQVPQSPRVPEQVQDEVKQNQDKILATIATLEKQFDLVTTTIATDKRDKEAQNEQLLLLRSLISSEQQRFAEHQKMLNDHERKILATQQLASEKRAKRPPSRFSDSPVSPRKHQEDARPKRDFHQQPIQFKMLEDRLKSLEAERSALLELNTSMHDENEALKRLAFSQNSTDQSGAIFKKQNSDLVECNNNLKSLVHRLNIELSRYQAKYRPPRTDEIEGLSLPQEGPIPEWLVNVKYLSPLIMAYDDRINDKNEVIRAYEDHLASFKTRMQEIVQENQRLHMMVSEKSEQNYEVAVDEWNVLQEQAKLVVNENAILMQEVDLKDRRISEIQDEHQLEISNFTKRVRVLENEKRSLQRTKADMQIDNEAWKKRHNEAMAEMEKRVTEEEVRRRIEEIQRPLEQAIEDMKRNKDDSSFTFKAVMKEKQELAIRLTDANSMVSRLQMEVGLLTKSLRKAERKLVVLDRKVGTASEKEMIATETLKQVLLVAEENSKERDVFAKLVESQNNETILTTKQRMANERRLEDLRKEVEKYKDLAKRKTVEVYERIKEKDNEILNIKNNYDQEIDNLRQIIASRKNMLDVAQTGHSQFENEVDQLWRSITEENEQLRKSLDK